MDLHTLLDVEYGDDGDRRLTQRLADGVDVERRHEISDETALHVAARRRRPTAVAILLDHGADPQALNGGGKTASVHAMRRGFDDVVAVFEDRGLTMSLCPADDLAVHIMAGRLDEARRALRRSPGLARTGNPEEDRLLADIAGYDTRCDALEMLIQAGADLYARGLDDGTALHQAAWFGAPSCAAALVDAGAPLEVFDAMHQSSPLGWAVHGSRYSGGADDRQDVYVAIVTLLLESGALMRYPDEGDGPAFRDRLLNDASPRVREVLTAFRPR